MALTQNEFDYVLTSIRELSQQTVSGSSPEILIQTLARQLSNTVAFLNARFIVNAIQTVLPMKNRSEHFPRKDQRFFHSADQKKIEELLRKQHSGPVKSSMDRNDKPVDFYLFPARWGETLVGYLVILSTNRPLSEVDTLVIENYLPILMQSIYNRLPINESVLNTDELFMMQVLLQRNPDPTRAKQYCALSNYDYEPMRICMVFEFPGLEVMPQIQRRSILEQQRVYLNKKLAKHANTAKLILIHENTLTVLRAVPPDKPRIATILEYEQLIAEIVQEISASGHDCFIGLSETCQGLETLSDCYFEASESIVLGKKIRPDRSWYSYHEQYLFHRLWHNFSTAELRAISVNILEPIMGDTPDFAELRRTLETYISCSGNLSQTAERLFIHRNTLNYRMTKLKTLLAVTEISADDFTRYMVGLTILKML